MKKMKFLRKTAAFAALVMCLEIGAAALGEMYYQSDTPIGIETSLHKSIFTYTNDKNEECIQNEHYIEYMPNRNVTPVVVYGSKVCNYGDFDTMAGLLERKGWNVIGGTNGDYYVLATYQPTGMLVADGVLHSSDGGLWSVGFRNDGTALIGRPETKASVVISNTEYRVYGINKAITKGDFYLYTDTYSYTTKNTVPTVNLILSYPEDYELRLNTEVELTVEEIVSADSELDIRDGKFILSLTQDSDSWRMNAINSVAVGDKLKFKLTANEEWDDIEYAVGAMYKFIDNGKFISEADDERVSPRTAVGMRRDGSIVFYTVDGRQSGYSVGMEIPELAERLLELGCVEACLLDGGGSTNLHVQYMGDESASQVNRPAYGSERSVSNYIMLVAKGKGSGSLRQIAVYPSEPIVLMGSSVQMSVKGADETSRPVEIDTKVWWLTDGGSIAYDGVYTPRMPGTYEVTAYVNGITDFSNVTVIKNPDTISLHKGENGSVISSLNVYTGESELIVAKARYNGMDILSSASAYEWEVVGDIGEINEEGVFTAGNRQGDGQIIVRAGDCSAAIEVTVGALVQEFESFEAYSTEIDGLNIETRKDDVRFGERSLRIDYVPNENGYFEAQFPITTGKEFRYLSMWIKGARKDTKLGAVMSDGSKTELFTVETAGWHQIVVPIAAGVSVEALFVEDSEAGSIWIDQICLSTTAETDLTPPDISIDEEDGNISVVISDNVDSAVEESGVKIFYDGKAIEFSYNEKKGIAAAYLEPEDGYHRISVVAGDRSGNIASQSLTLTRNAQESPFEDVAGHWAEEYVAYMYSQNVVNGVDDTVFAPDTSVTRAQCALMMCRWLGIDTSLYADVELDFVDGGDIPGYAADAVKAVYALGIITGLDTVEGVYFAPNSSLTREQAMTIIGRVQPGGYAQADISEYTDAAKVQSWADKYARELVGRGVIGGFEDGTLRPDVPVTRSQLVKILTEVR